jgi:hypothetical protein
VGPSLDGQTWRLPTVKELLTLVDHLNINPAIDATAFPTTDYVPYWTSSSVHLTSGYTIPSAWTVEFAWGSSQYADITSTPAAGILVRCVR